MSKPDGSLLKRMTIPGGTIHANSSRIFSSSLTFGPDIILSLIGTNYLTIKLDSKAGVTDVNDKIAIEATIILSLPHLP